MLNQKEKNHLEVEIIKIKVSMILLEVEEIEEKYKFVLNKKNVKSKNLKAKLKQYHELINKKSADLERLAADLEKIVNDEKK